MATVMRSAVAYAWHVAGISHPGLTKLNNTMQVKQYSLFENNQPIERKQAYPWEGIFDWMPQVGGLAQMHSVILPQHGYCYGDTVRIKSIKGQQVVCTVEHQSDKHWWKNEILYHCTIHDLWPNVYGYRKKDFYNAQPHP